jgi:hypothetical protein
MAAPRLKHRSYTIAYLLGGVAFIVFVRWWLGVVFADQHAAPEKLTDGRYYVDDVVDSVSFLVTPVRADGDVPKSFRVRLVGVKNDDNAPTELEAKARQFVKTFISSAPRERPIVCLQFDRYRIDSNDTALAYLWHDQHILNVELARGGFVLPDNIVGNSPSIQRKIKLASAEAQEKGVGVFRQTQ